MASKKEEYWVGDTQFPVSFSTPVILRMLNDDKLAIEFLENYNNARQTARATQEPTTAQQRIAKLRREGMKIADIARQEGITPQLVYYAISRVAMYEFYTKTA